MNAGFLELIFQSDEFVRDYKEFLLKFTDILTADNEHKILNISKILGRYFKTNKIDVFYFFIQD